MTEGPEIAPSDQEFLDRCLSEAAASAMLTKNLRKGLLERLMLLSQPTDIYNSDWPGFGRTVNLVSAIPLGDVISEVRKDFMDVAETTPEELVEAFRSHWAEIFYGGSGFFARELRGSEGQVAWVLLSPDDGGGYQFHGILPTPLAAEKHARALGWIFSLDPEGRPSAPDETDEELPSGRWDGFTDQEVLELLLGSPSREAG